MLITEREPFMVSFHWCGITHWFLSPNNEPTFAGWNTVPPAPDWLVIKPMVERKLPLVKIWPGTLERMTLWLCSINGLTRRTRGLADQLPSAQQDTTPKWSGQRPLQSVVPSLSVLLVLCGLVEALGTSFANMLRLETGVDKQQSQRLIATEEVLRFLHLLHPLGPSSHLSMFLLLPLSLLLLLSVHLFHLLPEDVFTRSILRTLVSVIPGPAVVQPHELHVLLNVPVDTQ